MKRILLYSGGVDSFITHRLIPGLTPVHFSFKTPYSELEERAVRENCPDAHIYRLPALDDLADPDVHIPLRNLLLILHSILKEGRNLEIYLPQILELGRDKNEAFFLMLSRILNSCYGYRVMVKRPFRWKTKAALIRKYIDMVGKPKAREDLVNRTVSCYNPGSDGTPCAKCTGCIDRHNALVRTGLIDGQIVKRPRKASHFSLAYVLDLPRIVYLTLPWT